MAYSVQNFYKQTLLLDWTIGLGNFYVSVKPQKSTGWLVISPNNSTLREIVKYTGTGTDTNGDYVTISQRGVGGTTEQTHTVGEPIRQNITAEYLDDINTQIASIVASGVVNANTTTMGGVEEATAAEIDARTQTGSTGAELFINPKILHDAHNVPTVAPGTAGNIMTSNGTDWGSQALAIPFIVQDINLSNTGNNATDGFNMTSNATGSVVFIGEKHSASDVAIQIYRLVKDSNSGNYYVTHKTTLSTANSEIYMACDATYLWVGCNIGGVNSLRRYSVSDLSGVTTITFSGTSRRGNMFSDTTNLWIYNGTVDQFDKFTISGTTVTNTNTPNTYTSASGGICICDGTYVWIADQVEGNTNGITINIRKYVLAGGTALSTKTYLGNGIVKLGSNGGGLFIASSSLTGIGYAFQNASATATIGTMAHVWAISN